MAEGVPKLLLCLQRSIIYSVIKPLKVYVDTVVAFLISIKIH